MEIKSKWTQNDSASVGSTWIKQPKKKGEAASVSNTRPPTAMSAFFPSPSFSFCPPASCVFHLFFPKVCVPNTLSSPTLFSLGGLG
jgi:hypothetical protein